MHLEFASQDLDRIRAERDAANFGREYRGAIPNPIMPIVRVDHRGRSIMDRTFDESAKRLAHKISAEIAMGLRPIGPAQAAYMVKDAGAEPDRATQGINDMGDRQRILERMLGLSLTNSAMTEADACELMRTADRTSSIVMVDTLMTGAPRRVDINAVREINGTVQVIAQSTDQVSTVTMHDPMTGMPMPRGTVFSKPPDQVPCCIVLPNSAKMPLSGESIYRADTCRKIGEVSAVISESRAPNEKSSVFTVYLKPGAAKARTRIRARELHVTHDPSTFPPELRHLHSVSVLTVWCEETDHG